MQSKTDNITDYLKEIPDERSQAFSKLRDTVRKNLPKGFEERIIYGMVGYVVPLKTYPAGYHCDPSLPLSFLSIANQKNFIALYHMGIYSDPKLLNWFVEEYPKHSKSKLDMGKSCIRFKKPDDIPFALIAELCQKMTPQQWIDIYEGVLAQSKSRKPKK
ncbi:MAG: hypothetical protein K0R26_2487 [Bacteroidota bacterium]|jgi:hypothetical protein|nr:hypothetical protein [Bacteroidota bacterium]